MAFPNRRDFLKIGSGALLLASQGAAQVAQGQAAPGAAAPGPKSARVTSSLMLWTLKGTFETKLAVAAEVGFQSVELVSEHLSWPAADVTKYKALAESYGLTTDAILGQRDWTKRPVTMVNPAHREGFLGDIRESIEWAKRLNVPQIIVMSGNVQPDLTPEAQHASMVESGKQAADLAASADLKLILEPLNSKVNHKGYYLTSNREGLEAVKQVDNPHFRLLFDIYHEQVQNGDVIPILTEAEPYVTTFHVADAPGRHDPGSGEMDYGKIYRTIGKSGYSGYIAMEYLPLGDEATSFKKAVTEMRKGLDEGAGRPAAAGTGGL